MSFAKADRSVEHGLFAEADRSIEHGLFVEADRSVKQGLFAEADRSVEQGLRVLFAPAWRHKFLFSVTSLVTFLLLLGGLLALQPTYEGVTLLISGQVGLTAVPDNAAKMAQTTNMLTRMAKSNEVLIDAIAKIGPQNLVQSASPNSVPRLMQLRKLLFPWTDTPQPHLSPVEAAVPEIKRRLIASGDDTSGIISIAFRQPNPVLAARFANAVAESLIERQISLRSRPGAVEFFLQGHARFDAEFERAARDLKDFSVTSGVYAASNQRELLLKQLSDLKSALAITRSSIAEKIGQRQALSDELRRLAPVARSPYVSALVDELGARSRIGSNDAKAINNRTSDPPLLLVRVYQDSMTTLFKINSDLAGVQDVETQQLAEVSKLTSELNDLSKNEQKYSELTHAVETARHNSDLFANRAIEEQITEKSNVAQFSPVRVLQSATTPLRPVFPNYTLGTLMALVLSGLFGAGVALLHSKLK